MGEEKIFLYLILCVICIIFFKLIEYTNIQSYIVETSRCFRKVNIKNYSENTYVIKGYTQTHIEVVKIIYNFAKKTHAVEIVAPKGDVLNKLNIPIYNIRTRQIEEIDRIFYAEIEFEQPFVYEGNPELISFMQYYNTDFFENKMLEDARL
jgi:hypothetical protein